MRRYKTLFYFCIVIAVVAVACSKGENTGGDHQINLNDSTTPVVVINNPSNNQLFKSGDVISVNGRVTDNGLYQGSIRITNDATGTIMKQQLYDIHDYQSYDFQMEYEVIVDEVSNYTITVQYQDHGLNTGSQSVKVKINP